MSVFAIQHVNVLVDDLDAACQFYGEELGLEAMETPDHDFPSQFFRFNESQELHLNEIGDSRAFRSHFCIAVENFTELFHRMKEIGAIDLEPWGKVRVLPAGNMQMFVRDPSGNLVELASRPGDDIDPAILDDDIVDAAPGLYVSGRDEHRRGK